MTERFIKKYFSQLDHLQKIIFACLINRNYAEREDEYEKKLHRAKAKLFSSLTGIAPHSPAITPQSSAIASRASVIASPSSVIPAQAGIHFYQTIISLSELIFSLNTLKFRITDHATFEVCERELRDISNSLSAVLRHTPGNNSAALASLSQAIENFSALYQNTLRMITADPSVFLFFIQALIDFREQMEKFNFPAPIKMTAKIKKITYSPRHLISMLIATAISFVIAYFFSSTGLFLIPAVALLVMQTPIASAFDQGIWRLLLVTLIVSIAALILYSMPFFYQEMQDVCIGALIGIATNLLILPRSADVEFRRQMVNILKIYQQYFSAAMNAVLNSESTREKIRIETELLKLPGWVQNPGFDTRMRKGHRFFLTTIERMNDVLFLIDYLADITYEQNLIDKLRAPLSRCTDYIEKFFAGLITLLELKKLSQPIDDFGVDLNELEEKFQNSVTLSLELLDVKRDYIYFAALIADLVELRQLLLKLAQALR